jgi:hypothetical protein
LFLRGRALSLLANRAIPSRFKEPFMNMRFLGIIALVCASAVSSACDEKLSSVAGPTPNLEPTFASIQHDIFEATDSSGRTPCVNCHTNVGRNPAGGLNLVHDLAYAQLVNVPSPRQTGAIRVVPGDTTKTYLLQKLIGTPGIAGARMPQNGPPYLTEGQISIIRRWVEIGAPNN